MDPSDHDVRDLGNGAPDGGHGPTHANEGPPGGEGWLRSVVENSAEIVTVVDPDGTLRYASPAFGRVFGYDPDQVVGTMNVLDHVHPDDLPHVLGETEKALSEGRVASNRAEYRFRHKDGSWRWVESVGTYLLDDPAVGGVVVQTRDVTERKEAEEALRESEKRLSSVVSDAHAYAYRCLNEPGWPNEYASDYALELTGYPPEDLLVGGKVRLGDLIVEEDRQRVWEKVQEALAEGRGFELRYAIRHRDGQIRHVQEYGRGVYGGDGEVVALEGLLYDVTERKTLEEGLEYQALHDPLTGLPNRSLFVDRLEQALARIQRRRDSRVAVLFMDLDGFKVVNDSLGHDTGDRLLVVVAERLKRCFRSEDTLARFAGDEFIVLLEEVEDADDALRVTQRITEEFREPFALNGREIFVRLSIGVAMGGADTESPEELLRDADIAMYRAKAEAADYRVFDPEMHEQALGRLELENDLRHALEKEEFTVYYQPKFRLGQQDGIEGIEALVRWKHPQKGFMLPGEFIPLAEETGLIIPIGGWVTKEACRQAKEWQDRYPSEPPLSVCVNLSAGQVRHPGLLREMRSALRESGLEPGSLILEITEGTLLKDTELIGTVFGGLKALGVRLAIDDFGKEYSSLSYLNRLPVDGLKIDRLFLESLGENPSNMIIVEAVITLAHSLGLEVTGEGVEKTEQLELLRGMGCDFAQGYCLARPLPSEEVEHLLVNRTAS